LRPRSRRHGRCRRPGGPFTPPAADGDAGSPAESRPQRLRHHLSAPGQDSPVGARSRARATYPPRASES
jgi:hypothetical protein